MGAAHGRAAFVAEFRSMRDSYKNFAEFYPDYLSQHQNQICRRLHFVGSSLVLLTALYAAFSGQLLLFSLLPVIGYGFAWFGHFVFEKNRPATFDHPGYSLIADWVMFKVILNGKLKL